MKTFFIITLIQSLAFMIALVLSAWYRPKALRTIGVTLIKLSESMQIARLYFDGKSPKAKHSKTPAPIAPAATLRDPLFEDVQSALVNLGTPAAAARRATEQALSAGRRDFETALKWRFSMRGKPHDNSDAT